jgi:hypothetical protein
MSPAFAGQAYTVCHFEAKREILMIKKRYLPLVDVTSNTKLDSRLRGNDNLGAIIFKEKLLCLQLFWKR